MLFLFPRYKSKDYVPNQLNNTLIVINNKLKKFALIVFFMNTNLVLITNLSNINFISFVFRFIHYKFYIQIKSFLQLIHPSSTVFMGSSSVCLPQRGSFDPNDPMSRGQLQIKRFVCYIRSPSHLSTKWERVVQSSSLFTPKNDKF